MRTWFGPCPYIRPYAPAPDATRCTGVTAKAGWREGGGVGGTPRVQRVLGYGVLWAREAVMADGSAMYYYIGILYHGELMAWLDEQVVWHCLDPAKTRAALEEVCRNLQGEGGVCHTSGGYGASFVYLTAPPAPSPLPLEAPKVPSHVDCVTPPAHPGAPYPPREAPPGAAVGMGQDTGAAGLQEAVMTTPFHTALETARAISRTTLHLKETIGRIEVHLDAMEREIQEFIWKS